MYEETNFEEHGYEVIETPEHKLASKIAEVFVCVLAGCSVSIIVALTAKFIFWLLF